MGDLIIKVGWKCVAKWLAILPVIGLGWGTFATAVYHIDNIVWMADNAAQIKEATELVLSQDDDGTPEHDLYLKRAAFVDWLMEDNFIGSIADVVCEQHPGECE